MLFVEELVKQYGNFTTVGDVSFEAIAGSVLGLLGPNGAGKSTSTSCISGLSEPTSGHISVAGHDANSAWRAESRGREVQSEARREEVWDST